MKKLIKKKTLRERASSQFSIRRSVETRLAQFTCYSTGNLWLMKIECLVHCAPTEVFATEKLEREREVHS